MKSFKNLPKPLYVALLTAPLLLAACTENGPWPLPSGYTYTHDEYKAPPGPQPVFKKWEYKNGVRQEPQVMPTQIEGQSTASSATAPTDMPVAGPAPVMTMTMTPSPKNSWQAATDELVSRMVADFGKPTESVWLEADASSPDSASFDKALRDSLAAQKIGIAETPGTSPFTLHYNAGDAGDSSGRLLLSIVLMSGGERVESESGIYKFSDSADASPAPSMAPESPASTTATSAPAPLVIDSSPTFAGEKPKPSGTADDIEPGPDVRAVVPEHRLND